MASIERVSVTDSVSWEPWYRNLGHANPGPRDDVNSVVGSGTLCDADKRPASTGVTKQHVAISHLTPPAAPDDTGVPTSIE